MEITDAEFWAIVDQIGWGTRKVDSGMTNTKFALQWTHQKMKSVRDRFSRFSGQLYRDLTRWEKDNDLVITNSSDGFSDLCAHIIGLGEKEFNAVLANPRLAYERAHRDDYTESFSYCLPYNGDSVSDAHFATWRASIREMLDKVREDFPAIDHIVSEIETTVACAGNLTNTQKDITARFQELHREAHRLAEKYVGTRAEVDKVFAAVESLRGWSHINYVNDMQQVAKAKRELGML